MTHEEQTEILNDYLACDAKIKKLEKFRDELKEQVVALGEGSHKTEKGSVSVTLGERKTLSQDILKESFGGEIPAKFYKTTASITVRVTKF